MRLIILGAGGYGRTVADVAAQTGRFDGISFLDDNSTAPDVVGKCAEYESFRDGQTAFYPAFGNNEGRLKWLYRLREASCVIPTIIHPAAYVSPTAQIEPGAVILPHAIIKAENRIPRCIKIEAGEVVQNRAYPL